MMEGRLIPLLRSKVFLDEGAGFHSHRRNGEVMRILLPFHYVCIARCVGTISPQGTASPDIHYQVLQKRATFGIFRVEHAERLDTAMDILARRDRISVARSWETRTSWIYRYSSQQDPGTDPKMSCCLPTLPFRIFLAPDFRKLVKKRFQCIPLTT